MWTPLAFAAVRVHASAVSALLAEGAKQPQGDGVTRRPCLLARSVERNHVEVLCVPPTTGIDEIGGLWFVMNTLIVAATKPYELESCFT